MKVTPIKTVTVRPNEITIFDLLDKFLPELQEKNIVVVTSKVVAMCENNVVPIEGTDRDALIQREAELYYTPEASDGHRYNFTIKQNTLIPASGIDVSNGNGDYVLWPKDSKASAHAIREYLMKQRGLKQLGVIITDSTIGLSRWGTIGIAIGHSGFNPVKDYIGKPDLFGKPLTLSKSNVAGGLAAAAVLVMGEGAEQTPIAIIEDAPGIDFWQGDTPENENDIYYISPLNDDPFKPFFGQVDWSRGGEYHD